jgi:leader peptidase (prepilin peptidase)/N-methyltransferase
VTETIALVAIVALFGLAIGSFLNVVVWRLPRKESLSHPSSRCPRCERPIRWYDNIPVVSWVILRGKCRDCGEPISARYPLVEAGTALFFAAVVVWVVSPRTGILYSGDVFDVLALVVVAVAYLYLAAISVALTLIDLDTQTLPNRIVLPAYLVSGVLLTAATALTGNWTGMITALVGATALFGFYFILAFAYPGGMGLGDVKLAGVLGLFLGWLGWGPLAVGAFSPFLFGGIFGLVLMVLRKVGRKSRIPFGPWMLIGSWVGIFVGDRVFAWYLWLFGLTYAGT